MSRLRQWRAELAPVSGHLVWLVFLVIPAYFLIVTPAPWSYKLVGTAGLLGHLALHPAALLVVARRHGPDDPPAHLWAHFWLLLTAQLMATVALVPALGVGAAAVMTYCLVLLALVPPVWAAFVGVTATLVVLLVAVGSVQPLGRVLWAWMPMVWTGVMLLISRIAMVGEQRAERLRLDLARSETRESIAADVHDLMGHSLSTITVKAELARRLIDVDPAAAARELTEMAAISREATDEVRATVRDLSTPDLRRQLRLTDEALRAAGIACRIRGGGVDLAEGRERLAAWVLREATTNVIRHAQATRCTIELSPDALVIHDDGVGLGTGDNVEGHGLRSMRRRAAAQDAHLTIEDAHPGTVVRLEFA